MAVLVIGQWPVSFEWSVTALKEMAFNCFYIYNVGEVCTSYFCGISVVLSKRKYSYTLLKMIDTLSFLSDARE